MKGFSKAIIAGNVVRDPELKTTPNGSSVCRITVAVNRSFKDSTGNMQDTVSYLDCTAWGRAAEIINQYVRKGSGILVSGRLEQRSWTDKATGQKRYAVETIVEDFSFLGGRNDDGGNSGYSGGSSYGGATAGKGGEEEIVPDDIPEEPINMDDVPF